MESQELRIFREVARAGSISKAAGQLGYVQSNVTARIKKLEEELNAVLVIRHSKGVTLTAEGERLLIASEDILDRIDRAAAQIRDRKTFRIGAAVDIQTAAVADRISGTASGNESLCGHGQSGSSGPISGLQKG